MGESVEAAAAWLTSLGYPPDSVRILPDGRIAWVHRLLFTAAILVSYPKAACYHDRWCYETRDAAAAALKAWNPSKENEPFGWHRHPLSGRRRLAGDAAQEYIYF